MNECLLCKRDMKKSSSVFGGSCLKNIYNFLDLDIPSRNKNKELYLYNIIMKKQKFNDVLNKLKNGKISDEEKIKLLCANCSFILLSI